jgi:hypothetical protein
VNSENHVNHGMHFADNYVTLSNVQSDVLPTKLTVAYTADSASALSVENSSSFSTFENVGVGTTNPGYLLIQDEIISYTQVSGNTIGGTITRIFSPTTNVPGEISISLFKRDYPAGTLVYKYELGGVSLRRINKTHNLQDSTISDSISFDSYNIKVNTALDGIDRSSDSGYPKLYMNKTRFAGGNNIKATQNIPFEIISPMIQNTTVSGTKLDGKIRTITGQSISGSEIPYQNSGFENISINKSNYLSSTRLICSNVNETNNLIGLNLPGNKSFNIQLDLETVDTRVSPVIDSQRINAIFVSNRVNSHRKDYD